ncbi:hypothetical protein [Candidatus Tisiphia endosymbiont of Nemotelus uliginosus]|uniref:hypothetical protein n=1 Tax=Candidatus Tisiphia endosymbiont of Nemotelus uliginosus TaxID=3077926 RepID=UPI0035C91E6D
MRNFFLVLLNRTFLSSDNPKDRIFQCNSDIYSDIQSNKKELMSDHRYLHSFIEKSCSIATYSNITSDTLFYTSIFPSNINNTIDVILHYNNTYSEYQKIDLNNTEDSLCPVNESWSDWLSGRLQKIYQMVCNSQGSQGYCIASYNALVSNDVIFLFNSLDSICPLTTTTHYTTIDSNRGVTSMNTTIVPQNERFTYYKQRVDGLANKTAVINTQLSLLNMLFLRNENSNLRLELKKVTEERDSLRKQVLLDLEAEIMLCDRRMTVLQTNLTTAQNHEKELQVKLDETTAQLQKANHSVHVVSLAVKKLRNSDVVNDDTIFFERQKENYTNHLNSYVQDKKSTDKSLRDTHQNIKTDEQEIERLRHQLQNKNIELDNTYGLLNITLSRIDQIHNNVTVLNNQIQDIVTHGISKRNINNQYNETQDNYAVSKQIMDASYEARVADSERKVEEILTMFASIERANNILKSRIHQNEEKEIEDLQSYNLTESNLKTSDITTTGQEVKNSEIINKVEDDNSDVKDDFVKSTKGNDANKSLRLPDDQNSFSISEENINYNKNQGGLMTSYGTTDHYDVMIKQVNDDIDHIMKRLQQLVTINRLLCYQMITLVM